MNSNNVKESAIKPFEWTPLKIALLSMVLGGIVLFIAGLANPQVLHDIAHDTRHALGFPCH